MEAALKHPLVAFREANGLSQAAAAARVGITQAMWSRLETRTAYVGPSVAKRIADLTGIALESLLNFGDGLRARGKARHHASGERTAEA